MVCGTGFYLRDFQEHVSAFQRHLAGAGHKELSSSIVPPSAYWTPPEKERFFHSLSIHTRFRPDLIALDVKSKSVADVCFYLAALEQASVQIQPLRNDLDIAITVPDSWIATEERESCKLREKDGEEWNGRLDSHKLHTMDQILQERDSEDSTAAQSSEQLPSTSNGRPTDSEVPLSPAERRRLYKRLYMRRKRARLSGTTADLHANKLQPGKKTKIENGQAFTPGGEEHVLDVTQHNLQDDDSDDANPSEEKSVEFEREAWKRSGIDADVLVSRDLGLFHLGALEDLIKLYKLTSDERLPAPVTSSISATTIQTLDSIVKNFTSQIIHQCIVLREEEWRFKGQTKVWHIGSVHDEISSSTVNRALAIMGHSRTRKTTGLTELSKDAGGIEEEKRFDALDTSTSGGLEPFFCRIPKNFDESDELMPDEEALLVQLEEDLELDKYDRTVEIEYEQRLKTVEF